MKVQVQVVAETTSRIIDGLTTCLIQSYIPYLTFMIVTSSRKKPKPNCFDGALSLSLFLKAGRDWMQAMHHTPTHRHASLRIFGVMVSAPASLFHPIKVDAHSGTRPAVPHHLRLLVSFRASPVRYLTRLISHFHGRMVEVPRLPAPNSLPLLARGHDTRPNLPYLQA